MTYQTIEESSQLGSPIELYEFAQGLDSWRYNSSAVDIEYNFKIYKASSIARDRVKGTTDIFKNDISFTFPRSNEFAKQFLGFAAEEVTTVTILRGHADDIAEEYIAYWKGRVVGASASDNEIRVDCESVFTSLKRPGLRAKFEYGCRHTLYSPQCGAGREINSVNGSISDIQGLINISVNAAGSKPDGFYTGGMLQAPDGTLRFIVDHVGIVLTISRPLYSLAVGDDVKVFAGCDHLKTTCKNKFNNLNNFGGFPYIPTVNPFDGNSIG